MPTDKERREVAAKLRDIAVRTNPSWPALMEALGTPGRAVTVMHLADLIEPTLETCELEQLKAKLGAVSRIADKYHDRASTILESWGDKPMGGTDLGRFHAFEQMVGEIWETLE